MRFTRQDALTFGIGLIAALLIVLGEGLISLEESIIVDLSVWTRSLLVGFAGAIGRYLITRIPELLTRRYPPRGE